MEVPAALNVVFPPSANILVDVARRPMDDAMLMEIARADYGEMAHEMFAELRPIRDDGIIRTPMHWQLVEVLELTRWCYPEVPERPPFDPGPTGRRGHQVRLFTCAVLLRASAESANEYVDSAEDSTLANCLGSAGVLGEEVNIAVARFLTWRIPQVDLCAQPLFFPLALLVLAARLRAGRLTDADLGNAAEWIMAEETRWRQVLGRDDPSDPQLLAFSLQQGLWEPLATELLREAEAIPVDEVRTNLQLCSFLMRP